MSTGAVLVISPYRWGRYPGRHYELTGALADRVPVVQLTVSVSAGVRTPSVRQVDHGGMAVVTWTLDRVTGALMERGPTVVATAIARRLLRPALERLPVRPTRAWSWIPLPWVTALVDGPTVVDLIDPPLDGDFARAHRLVARLVARGVALSCTAEALADDVRAAGGSAEVIPNGWSGTHGSPPPAGAPFTCAYVGTIDERFDHDLVLAVARALPDVRFVIAGRLNHDQAARFAPVAALPNVTAPGPLPYGTSPGFDIGLIPFRTGPLGDRINPVKMYDYLAAGAEVVASDIRECRAVPLVRCAATADEMVAHIRAVQAGDRTAPGDRAGFLATTSWGVRAEQVLDRLARLDGLIGGGGGIPGGPQPTGRTAHPTDRLGGQLR